MSGSVRLDWIRHRLESDGTVMIAEAARSLEASPMTIRRDLAHLCALGEARRIRGGAQAVGPSPFRERSPRNARAKVLIAEKCVGMVPTVGTIAIDSSSTMACLVNLLDSARDLVVVTNGLEAFESLQGRPGIRPVLTGGDRDRRTSSLVGPVAEATVTSFHFDVAFVSAAGLAAESGATEATIEEAAIVRAVSERSHRVVLGADSSKLDAPASAVSLAWSEIEVLVTELQVGSPRLDRVRTLVRLA